MKKILLLLLLSSPCLFAQGPEQATRNNELPQIIPPSPTVAGLMHFEEVPVDYYSGQPDINIPLFSKAIGKNLSLDLALRYSTMGVRVNERSGWVGTGWNLECGGMISRTVRGIADELQKGVSGNQTDTGVLHNPDFWNYQNLNFEESQEFLWNVGGTRTDKFDSELDLYQYSFLGKSGRFIIILENGILKPKLLTKSSNIKIELDYDVTTYHINKFNVTDTKGNRYTFDVKENSEAESVTGTLKFGNALGEILSNKIIKNVSAWHLSKVETSNEQELVSFEYTAHDSEYISSISRVHREIIDSPIIWSDMILNSYNVSVIPPKKEYTYNLMRGESQKLSKIIFQDNISIDFTSRTDLHPETKGVVLETISIKNPSGQENKSYKLNYETTSKSFSGGVEKKRLWLKTVEEIANSKTNQYILEYNDKEELSFFDGARDDWGYNLKFNSLVCGLTKPDKNAIQKGLLKNITYPTGGVKEFIFENNTISYHGGATLTDDEYREMNPDNWESEYLSMVFDSNTDNAGQGSLTKYSFTITQEHEVRYKKNSVSVSFSTDPEPIDPLLFNTAIKITGVNSENTVRLSDDETSFTLSPGTYDVRLYSFSNTARILANLCIGYKTYNTNILRYVYGGGVRIKESRFKENPDAVNPAIKTTYVYEELGSMGSPNLNFSYGAIDGNLYGLSEKYYDFNRRWLFTTENDCLIFPQVFTLKFLVTSKTLSTQNTKGNYVGYKKVRVLKEDNGYSTFEYTSPQDYFNDISVFKYPYAPPKNIDYKRGLLLNNEIYNNADLLVNKTSNSYIFEEEFVENNYSRGYKVDSEWKVFFEFYDNHKNSLPTYSYRLRLCGGYLCDGECISNYLGGPYALTTLKSNDLYSGWAKLNETNTKEYYYDNGVQSEVNSRATYEYDDINFQVNKQDMFYDEGGIETHMESKYFYPTSSSSYPGSANSSSLTGLNKINEVIGAETYKNGKRISSTRNMYKEFSPGLVLPEIVQSSKGEVTLPAGGGLYDPLSNLEDRLTYHRYDEYGNPLEVSKKDGTRISYIWGHNATQPIAKIQNASYTEIAAALGISENQLLDYNESHLSQINGLRTSLPKAMVSTYIYKLLVGITSMTDPRGYTTTYEYDEFNRLKYVRDAQGIMVSKNEYNYRTQN